MRLTTLTTLVVLFVAAVTLASTIPKLWLIAERESRTSREAAADAVAAALSRVDLGDPAAVDAVVRQLARTSPILSVTVDLPVRTDNASTRIRNVGSHRVTIQFKSDGKLAGTTRTALIAGAGGAVAALVFGAVSLFELIGFFRASRARGALPQGESQHLIQTMQSSIQMMKGREQELRRLHERVQERADELAAITATLVRSLTSGFIAIDDAGRIIDMNQAARELLHYGGAAAGITPRDALGGEFGEALQSAVDRRAAVQRTEIEEDDGTMIGLTTVPLLDDSGRHFGMLALFVDLTPVRQLENRLRQMQSLADLGEMSAGIAHEFRNSLSTILGYLRLARKAAPAQPIDQTIARAEAEAKELSTAVDSLLTFTRPMDLQPRRIDLTALVASIADRLRGLSDRVELTMTGGPVHVAADAALLSRGFENLIRNAFDAVADKGADARIDIRVEAQPAPCVTISDNGPGIAAGQASKLFVPFQSTKPSGFGLGLAMTRKIVLFHGGVVTLESADGGGAVATVHLPVAEETGEETAAAAQGLARYFL
jgi:two-component system, NtrC family, sensor histidine kinase PilS